MHADLWIGPDDPGFDRVMAYSSLNGGVRLRLYEIGLTVPDATARALVHALLAHYAGRVDFHLFEPSKVEAVDQGLRASLRELDREANNEEPYDAQDFDTEADCRAAQAFSERKTP